MQTTICMICHEPFRSFASVPRKYCSRKCYGIDSGKRQRGRKTGKPAHNRLNPDRPLTPYEKTKRHLEKAYAEIDRLPKIKCACGCGALIAPINKQLKPARFAHGHNPSTPPNMAGWNKGKPAPWASRIHKGKKLSAQTIEKIKTARRANHGGLWQTKRGWKHTPETIERMRVVNKAKALKGERNPFYGKKHTPEARAKMSAKLTGENNPGWNGGISTLPYGPEFTRKFKRQIRERDNYTCQRCGKKQEEHWRALEIHHKDHNKENNQPDNLVTVCGSCNVWLSHHRDQPFAPLNQC